MKEKIKSCENFKCIKLKNNFFWIIGILITIIILLICGIIYLKKEETVSMGDLISISSGLVSIALAIIAILYAISESIKVKDDNEKNIVILEKVNIGLNQSNKVLDEIKMLTNKVNDRVENIESYYKKVDLSDFNNEIFYDEKEDENILDKNEEQIGRLFIERGDIVLVNFDEIINNKLENKYRPAIIVQNNIGNKYSKTTSVAFITSKIRKAKLPTHIEITANESGLRWDSVIILETVEMIKIDNIIRKIGHINDKNMMRVNKALLIQFNLDIL